MNNNKNFGEKIAEYSVVLSALIIFFGFLKQDWYYSSFEIEIQNFLSIEEVLIMFLGELPFIIKLLLFAVAYYIVIIVGFKFFISKNKRNISTEIAERKFIQEFDAYFSNKKNLLVLLIISSVLGAICFFIFKYTFSELAIVLLTLMFCQTIYILLDIIDLDLSPFMSNMIAFVFSLTVLLYCKNIIDIKEVIDNPSQSTIIYQNSNNEEIMTSNILIGKTRDFLFFYNPKDKTTDIIRADRFICLKNKPSNDK